MNSVRSAGDFPLKLADGLDEGLPLDIADRSADLGDDDVGLFADAIDLFLDLVCDVGDDLHGAAVIAAVALALQDVEEDLTGGDGGIAAEVFIDEALVVAEVEVGLRAVLGDENFPVLIGVHGAGVDVEIGVEFLDGHRVAARLEEPAQRGGGDALPQRRGDAAGHKDVPSVHALTLPEKTMEL